MTLNSAEQRQRIKEQSKKVADYLQQMTQLSPAAQAVLNAYWDAALLESGTHCGLAAALRAAALYCKRDALILLSLADELEAQ